MKKKKNDFVISGRTIYKSLLKLLLTWIRRRTNNCQQQTTDDRRMDCVALNRNSAANVHALEAHNLCSEN